MDETCTADGCEKSATGSRRMCPGHYRRWQLSLGYTCAAEGCDRPTRSEGAPCDTHRSARWRANRTAGSPCAAEGCDQLAAAKGMCGMHYQRVLRHGDPLVRERSWGGTVEEKLWFRTTVEAAPEGAEVETDCWVSHRGVYDRERPDGGGNYRGIKVDGVQRTVHLTAYLYLVGPVPEGHQIHHRCHRKECWRPDHLVALTPVEHRRLHLPRKTHCPQGHEYTPENAREYVDKKGYLTRFCRACERERSRLRKARARAARQGSSSIRS